MKDTLRLYVIIADDNEYVAAKAAADADAENDPHNAPLAHEVGVLPRRKEA